MHHRHHSVLPRHGDIRRVFVGRREVAESGLGQPDALLPHLGEIRLRESRLEDDRPGMHAHTAGTIHVEALTGGNGQGLDARRIAWTAGHMHFRRADAGGDAAVDVAFEEADGLLPRGVVAERDVDVGIDQARHRRHAARVDLHIVLTVAAAGSDGFDLASGEDDRVADGSGRGEIARQNLAEIEDRDLHSTTTACCPCVRRLHRESSRRPGNSSAPRWQCRR